MATMIVEIFEGENPGTTFKVPLAVFQLAAKLLPRKALDAMEREGMAVQEVIRATKSGELKGQVLEVIDRKDNERIVITVE